MFCRLPEMVGGFSVSDLLQGLTPMPPSSSDTILTRMMTLHPKLMDLTLGRVWRLLAALDNPQEKLPPVIHLAGTNGKGSTQAMIRAGIEGMGKSAHAYTSPHLARFHERICLAGELITEDHLTEILDECYEKNGGETITYFEITTVAGLLAFTRTPADYTLLEVGLQFAKLPRVLLSVGGHDVPCVSCGRPPLVHMPASAASQGARTRSHGSVGLHGLLDPGSGIQKPVLVLGIDRFDS